MTARSLVPRPITQPTEILNQLQSGQLLRVKGCSGNAIIICHRHHAELAGPGAAVGSSFDNAQIIDLSDEVLAQLRCFANQLDSRKIQTKAATELKVRSG
jgi:hypothetical protein